MSERMLLLADSTHALWMILIHQDIHYTVIKETLYLRNAENVLINYEVELESDLWLVGWSESEIWFRLKSSMELRRTGTPRSLTEPSRASVI